jgi:hypothetical protein
MKNNPQQNENNNAKHQFSNTEVMTFSQQTEFLKTMSNNKQSSIEWLLERIEDVDSAKIWEEIKKQAKAMHKEEIIHAYNQSWHFRDKPYETGEKHYNETFGGNNEQQ